MKKSFEASSGVTLKVWLTGKAVVIAGSSISAGKDDNVVKGYLKWKPKRCSFIAVEAKAA